MTGYRKGTSAASEIAAIREAFARAVAAIKASPNAEQAFKDSTTLGELGKQLSAESAAVRAQVAASLLDSNALTLAQLAASLGVSRSRAAQLVNAGRKGGITVTDPGTEPEPASVALAIIAHDGQTVIEHRIDEIPPWTFPAVEIEPSESPAAALLRRVPEETGLTITVHNVIGRRIHPRTGRVMIYMEAEHQGPRTITPGAPEDLDDVRWVLISETRDLMPDMFPPVRAYLDRQAGQ